jgi:hypothetical protein
VIVAVWSAVMVPAVVVNAADAVKAATVTELGTVRLLLLSLRVTVAPLAGAAFERVTVQVAALPVPRLVGLQESEDTTAGATRERGADCEVLL